MVKCTIEEDIKINISELSKLYLIILNNIYYYTINVYKNFINVIGFSFYYVQIL